MPVTLPYQFDTSGTIKLILGGVPGLLVLVVVPGILYSLFISHSIAAAVQLVLAGTFAAWFGRVVVRNLPASVGTITAEAVVVHPARLTGSTFRVRRGNFRCGSSAPYGWSASPVCCGRPNRHAHMNACRSVARRARRTFSLPERHATRGFRSGRSWRRCSVSSMNK
jgi:hypothetical protein